MLSSANIISDEFVFFLTLLCFFVPAVLYTISVLIYHIIKKELKNFLYYFLSFILSGVVGLAVIAFFGYTLLVGEV